MFVTNCWSFWKVCLMKQRVSASDCSMHVIELLVIVSIYIILLHLVGGFNPPEKYARQIGSFPQERLKIKDI